MRSKSGDLAEPVGVLGAQRANNRVVERKKCTKESLKNSREENEVQIIQGGFHAVESCPSGDSRFLQGTDDWQVTNKPRRPSVAWLRSDRPGLSQPVLSNAVSKYQANYC